jgi:hypothetical protein
VPILGPLQQAQAVKFHKQISSNDGFTASNGWLSGWKICHRVSQVSIEREPRSKNSVVAAEFCETLHQMIDECECNEEQLYSSDETALYYRMLPTKFLDINKSAAKCSMKISKERVTLLFCTNKTGSHKLKPLCVGKN